MAEAKSNVYIFFGQDDFSLRQRIDVWKQEFSKKFGSSGIVQFSSDNLSETDLIKKLEETLTPSLFSSKKLIIAKNVLPAKASQEYLASSIERLIKNIPSEYFLVFWQDSLDRRIGFIKNLSKQVNLSEFQLLHGRELNIWIKKQALKLGLNMDDRAIEQLAVLCGRDFFEEKKAGGRVIERKEFFDLWQIYMELKKLSSLGTGTITITEVNSLVVPKIPENVFALSEAVVNQNKSQALDVLENLVNQENTDDKSMAVKLIGLLSEQLRSLLLVSLLASQNMNQNQIADYLGWSSGRVFITLKNAARMNQDRIKLLLRRLLGADLELKSSDTNPKLLIDLLIAK
jgi:DNA polymerase-3 subunit delta